MTAPNRVVGTLRQQLGYAEEFKNLLASRR